MGQQQVLCGAPFALLVAVAVSGCDQQASKPKVEPGDAERISISASAVIVGFQSGKLRNSETLPAFEISPLPITARQYAACVKAKGCPPTDSDETQPSAQSESEDSSAEATKSEVDEVASGVSVDGAKAFCSWVGGVLPSLPQWLLAARGVAPQRFAWGDQMPTCKEHPGGLNVRETGIEGERERRIARSRAAASYEPCGTAVSSRFAVDQHPAGTSVNGLKDTLLASAELLAKYPTSIFGSCRGKEGFCEVFGSMPGAIDFVREAEATGQDKDSPATAPSTPGSPRFAFRCAWSKGAEK
jgi:hypothetical protein